MRFDFESKPETYCANTIREVVDDVSFEDSEMLVILYGNNDFNAAYSKRRYFRRMRRIFKQYYKSRDEYNFDESEPYIVAYRTNRKHFNLNKYLADYFCDDQRVDAVFASFYKNSEEEIR